MEWTFCPSVAALMPTPLGLLGAASAPAGGQGGTGWKILSGAPSAPQRRPLLADVTFPGSLSSGRAWLRNRRPGGRAGSLHTMAGLSQG